ncbi:predicted protein [Arabidopsis lyrata subsp. lyrata]|uniref:Predicted protein n=1 Tax=Arabidopsis lyrata subsp. lyrata TaxID=81972 RepID=D7L112_ARALL|nr:predicted protein [Arabidopsis lyrata subsp. lyrata]
MGTSLVQRMEEERIVKNPPTKNPISLNKSCRLIPSPVMTAAYRDHLKAHSRRKRRLILRMKSAGSKVEYRLTTPSLRMEATICRYLGHLATGLGDPFLSPVKCLRELESLLLREIF